LELEDAKKAAAFKKAMDGRLEWEVGGGRRLGQTRSRRVGWPRLELEVEVKVGGGGAEAKKASAWQGRQRSGV